ncbi:glycosyl hydrolase [Sphingomonas sp. Leaf17]|uniref:family 43 glycosylhydrolase n=1 Tax=Sphingomonas sp. Leaf17 TaxID=1735683 RepID=UPI0007021383|nr:family 43 glycosylhydrolase [Sphingomonas sp. Leaf17]KQM65470.1 glycosyl hydrolase [Sphingomonas sp. Leaf17]
MPRLLWASLALVASVVGTAVTAEPVGWTAPGAGNPLLPGYFADPSIVRHDGEWFIYATIDPWGGETLGLWRSRDFRHWTFSTLNWPTKSAASSPTSNTSRVWAPSVVRARDGRFWMYVSVGSEVWVGVANHPAGPWRNALGDRPLIPGNFRPGYHMIDAEVFVDDDGTPYLYWGSGLNWVNGHCFAVRLKPDMVTFDGEPVDVTPAHYFEAPFMFKANGHYFLTYSWGNTTRDTYQVRYAVGASPLGPFTEPRDAPLLATDSSRNIISPGHHAIARIGTQPYILYHRQALPYPPAGDTVLRQVAIDRLVVRGNRLDPVRPTHAGPVLPGLAKDRGPTRTPRLTASHVVDTVHAAGAAGDDNYATGWDAGKGPAWLQADFGVPMSIGASELRPAFVTSPLTWTLQTSLDGQRWRDVGTARTATGSPIALPVAGRARYVRLVFADAAPILEWRFPESDQ